MYQFKFADIGEGVEEGVLLEWLVKEGDQIKDGDSLFLVETDKVNAEIPSPVDGKVVELKGQAGDTIHVGDLMVVIDDGSQSGEQPISEEEEESAGVIGEIEVSSEVIPSYQSAIDEKQAERKILATPVARKLAKDLGVDLTTVEGSGEVGRILKEDIEKAAKQEKTSTPASSVASQTMPMVSADLTVAAVPETVGSRREKIDSTRKAIVKAMTLSKAVIPHTVLMDEVDVTALVHFRQEQKEKITEVKLTYMPFIIKAVAKALEKYPVFNAVFDQVNQEIVYKEAINVGMAVDTDYGLVVPAIKDSHHKGIITIAKEINDLATKAANKKLTMAELTGGTFTVTNYGSVGSLFGTPIIKHPELAILGVGKITKKPVVIEDTIAIRSILPLSIAVDHRIIDGADAGRFVNEVKRLLTDPMLLMMS